MRKVVMIDPDPNDPNKKKSPGSIIGGILFLTAFVGSIIAMFITSQTDPFKCLLIVLGFFGFMFLLAGCQHLRRLNIGNLVFLTIGIESVIGMFVVYRLRYGDTGQQARMLSALPTLGCAGCMLVGLVLIFGGILAHRLQEKRCSQEISAQVISMDIASRERNSASREVVKYAPRVRFHWFGRAYEASSDVAQEEQDLHVGDTVTIFINPEDPLDFRIPGRNGLAGSIAFGCIMIALAVGLFILFETI